MVSDIIFSIIIAILTGGTTTGIIVFFGKNWITKSIDHSFSKKIEDYKQILGKENISFQIDKTEFSKKKFELVMELYLLVLERKKRNSDGQNIIPLRNYFDIRTQFDDNQEFDRKMRESISIASLFLNPNLIALIDGYMITSVFLYDSYITIAESEIQIGNFTEQQQFIRYKVISGTNQPYDRTIVSNQISQLSGELRNKFDTINAGFKDFLSVK